jgi:hypothetical protein
MLPALKHCIFLLACTAFCAAAAAADAVPTGYSIRCDQATGLCWQDPQKNAYDLDDPGVVAAEAQRYCAELVLGGYDDWRLPDSDELRALIDGNPATKSGGQCVLTIGGERNETLFRACEGGEQGNGPGADRCYMQDWLTGTCHKKGPATATRYLEIWASNRPVDDAEGWQAYVSFDRGALGYNHINSAGDVRCVRERALSTMAVGGDTSETGRALIPDPAADSSGVVIEQTGLMPQNSFVAKGHEVAELDPCDTSDKLVLNIHVPDKLKRTPDRLMAFLYRADKWRFPPAGPPDGGTDYNTLGNPEFSEQGNLTMVLPGCTFYRERMLAGEYRVYVQLLMENRRPPMVMAGDYYWGSNTEVFTLPLDGAAHRGARREVAVALWPVVNQ